MKDLWRDFWTREPSETEKKLREEGFTEAQASNLIDLRLKFEYGQFEDDGGPARRAGSGPTDKAA